MLSKPRETQNMNPIRQAARAAAVFLLAAGLFVPLVLSGGPANAAEILYIVDNRPITSYDISRRAAFLRLQQRGGNAQQVAAEELIDEAVRRAEISRLRINISDDQVNEAYERFARTNDMNVQQLNQIMNESGVTPGHFREFIRTQMGWSQAVSRRGGPTALSEQEVARRIRDQGGVKPTATEFVLQQVIFVIPTAERGAKMAARRREAEGVRQRFQGCEATRQVVRGMLDVTVRDLGRFVEQELPDDWASMIRATAAGSTTGVRDTDRGVEFVAICAKREISDDRVAQMVFSQQGAESQDTDAISQSYTTELRQRANIVRR